MQPMPSEPPDRRSALMGRLIARSAQDARDIARSLERSAPDVDTMRDIGGLIHRLSGAASIFGLAGIASAADALADLLKRGPTPAQCSAAVQRLQAQVEAARATHASPLNP